MQNTGIRVRKKESEVGQGEKRYSVVLQIPPQIILCFVLRAEKPYSRLEREFHGVPIKSSHNLLELHSFILSWISPNGDLYLVLSS